MNEERIKWSELTHFTERQKEATRTADEFKFTLYGGAGGGGKSYWLRWYPIRWLINTSRAIGAKGIRAGLFCEDYISLKDRHLTKMQFEFPDWLGEIKESKTEGLAFILKPQYGGGVLALRNLDDPSKYYSAEFALIAVDELTKNLKETFDFLRFRLRWSGITNTRFIAGTNPGQIGHNWVKEKWIDGRHDPNEREADQFKFVPAMVTDNPYIDPSYLMTLDSLPERMRKAVRDGNWDIFEGQYFTEWDRAKHVVEPFKIPDSWITLRSIDPSGHDGITSCHWYAIDHDGRVWVYREYYATRRDTDEHAKEINRLSEGEDYRYTCIDTSAFSKLGLPETQAEVFERYGVTGLIPSSKQRVTGWDIVHQYLRWDDTKKPMLQIFDTCPELIRTIPMAIHDQHKPEDVDTRGEDHGIDELRYLLQTLREQRVPKPLSIIERRLAEIKEQQRQQSFSYSYMR